jgi:hypothetical protein
MERTTAIRRSLAAFVWGLVGAVPVIGFIPAVCALGHWWAVRSAYRNQWNPASAYLAAGGALAIAGLLSTVLFGAVLAFALVSEFF